MPVSTKTANIEQKKTCKANFRKFYEDDNF
jgi:hypothetical protein